MVNLLSFLYFCLLSLYFTWPLALNLSTKIIDLYDGLQLTWIINWVIHALTTNPWQLFQANIFYPYKNTLAYSQLHIAEALLTLPFVKILKEPILAFNINLLAGFLFCGFFTYLLIKYLTKSPLLGLIGGTLFSFSTIHLNYLGHLDYFSFQYFIFSVYLFYLFLEKKKKIFFISFFLFSVLTTLNSFYVGYFLVMTIFIISLFDKAFKWFIFWAGGLFLFCLPFFLPFFRVSRQFNYVRPIREVIHFSLQPEDLLYPGGLTKVEQFLLDFFHLRVKESSMKTTPSYLGLAFSFLSFFSIFIIFKQRKYFPWRKKPLAVFLLIATVALILSFGPVMHWARKTIHKPFIIPLPYAFLYYVLPGFKGFRVPSRFLLLYSFALAVIISLVLKFYFKRLKITVKILMGILICFFVIWEFKFPLIFSTIEKQKNYPKVYYFLNSFDNKSPIMELPILNWDAFQYVSLETKRELYSTINFRPMVNGNSGFTPPEREILMKKIMLEFPNEELIRWLKKIKVKYLIVHKDDYQLLENGNFSINGKKIITLNQLLKRISEYKKDFLLIKKVNNDFIYEIKK